MLRLPGRLVAFLRRQQMFVVMGVVIYALFVALHVPVLLLGALIGAFLCGNLTMSSLEALAPLYGTRKFPYDWLIYGGLVLVISPVTVGVTIWLTGLIFSNQRSCIGG